MILVWRLPELGPCQDGVKRRTQSLPPLRETVFHLGRNLSVDLPRDNAVGFHLAQLLAEHLLGNGGDRALKLREAQHGAPEEVEQDDQLPATFEEAKSCFYVLGSR